MAKYVPLKPSINLALRFKTAKYRGLDNLQMSLSIYNDKLFLNLI